MLDVLPRTLANDRFEGLAYEHIPGPAVAKIEHVSQSAEGIEGYEGFVHLAYRKK